MCGMSRHSGKRWRAARRQQRRLGGNPPAPTEQLVGRRRKENREIEGGEQDRGRKSSTPRLPCISLYSFPSVIILQPACSISPEPSRSSVPPPIRYPFRTCKRLNVLPHASTEEGNCRQERGVPRGTGTCMAENFSVHACAEQYPPHTGISFRFCHMHGAAIPCSCNGFRSS